MIAELHLVARVGTERFAFPVVSVDEAIDAPVVAWVPRAREGLLGELCYRDRTVSAYDAGWAFGVPRATPAGTALILRGGVARIALLVDDVEDLHLLEPGSVRAVPAGADTDGILRGVFFAGGRGGRLVGLVRVEALLVRAGVGGGVRVGERGAAAAGSTR